ncbi:DUF4150 domain-containing protein [Mesorhizobium sp. LjRoot246]|uniref:DUF4150 domain-containing protein n=1 Tax=Mesorhizobium sp. LjRoot246 TaxID=3342294 RepID=UPI003ECF9486
MTVFANGLEVSCKAQSNKVIAAFPDVCFTPPENPATPPGVPVPYPTFGVDSDTDKGTGSVKIGGENISQKNKSYYTKTTGTEPGCAAKKGIINSNNTGKKYNEAWSPNVKAEKMPVTRFSDITTNNHGSNPNAPTPMPQVSTAGTASTADTKCLVGEYQKIKAECSKLGGQAHHVVPDKAYRTCNRAMAEAGVATVEKAWGSVNARIDNAPKFEEGICICLAPKAHSDTHANERAALGAIANNGTAPIAKIVAESCSTLDELEKKDGKQPDLACIDDAKDQVEKQTENFKDGQVGRTSNAMPNEAACKLMCPP